MKSPLVFLPPLVLSTLLSANVAPAQAERASNTESDVAEKPSVGMSTGLSYTAPEGCPDAAEYQKRVMERARSAAFVEHDASRSFVVTITRNADLYHGSFRVRGGRSSSAARTMSSHDCDEVVDALAVVGGIALSPTAEEEKALAAPVQFGEEDTYERAQAVDAPEEADVETEGEGEGARQSASGKRAQAVETEKQRRNDAAKKLRQGHLISVDIQAGATMERAPEDVAPRFDLTIRTGALLSPSYSEQFLWGFVPRIRGNVQMLSRVNYYDYEIHINGFGFAAGGCYTPYFDPDGFKVFGCADFGVNHLTIDPGYHGESLPSQPGGADEAVLLPQYWTGAFSFTLESEFKIVSFVHGALRAGIQQETAARHVVEGDLGENLMTLSNTTFVASGGIGVHF